MSYRPGISNKEFVAHLNEIASLKAGFDELKEHVVITNPNGYVVYANEAAVRNTGFPAEEMLLKNPGDLWGARMPKEFYEKMWHTIKVEKKPFVGEVLNRHKDGSEYWLELHISPVLDEAGEVRLFIGIEPDITDRKEKEHFRDEFISILGHQLKSPLTAMKWALELISKRNRFFSRERKTLESMYASNQTLINLVGDILTLSRLGSFEPKEEPFDLGAEISTMVGALKVAHPNVSFTMTGTEGGFPLAANKSLALQVFSNLIANAAEYAGKPRGRIAVLLEHADGEYRFSVEDNGIGIPLGDQKNIFSRFFRASNAAFVKKGGTGLGLYIVKLIADHLGWSVYFKSPSPQGTGAIFYVTIPTISKMLSSAV